MKFLIDASMPRSTKSAIKSLGYDSVDVRDVLAPAASDNEVASLAIKEDRIILTRDLDFANVLLYPPEKYPGIIVVKVRTLKPLEINDLIKLFLKNTASSTIANSLIILEPNRFRTRK